MVKINVSFPSLRDLSRNGVDAILLFMGTLLLTLGAVRGDFSVLNHELMAGAILVCGGFAWRSATSLHDGVSYVGEHEHLVPTRVATFLLFLAATVILACVAVQGHWPHH